MRPSRPANSPVRSTPGVPGFWPTRRYGTRDALAWAVAGRLIIPLGEGGLGKLFAELDDELRAFIARPPSAGGG